MGRTGAWLAWLGALFAFLAGLAAGLRMAWRTLRGVSRFLDDWNGDEERGRLGVIARLDRLEQRTAQLEPNGGHSVADKVARIATAVGATPEPPGGTQ